MILPDSFLSTVVINQVGDLFVRQVYLKALNVLVN